MFAKLKGWKTVIANSAIAMPSFLLGFMPLLIGTDWTLLGVSVTLAARIAFGLSILNIYLRMVTTTPVGQATP